MTIEIKKIAILQGPSTFGSNNFFSMGDYSKIIFSVKGFSYIGKSKKIIFMVIWGPNGSLGAFWLILGLKGAIFEQFSKKIYFFCFLRSFYTSKQ